MKILRTTFVLLATAWSLALSILCVCHAQVPNATPGTQRYRIAGRVLSAANGRPLDGAIVSISVVQANNPLASSTTVEGGAFSFEGLAPGKYSLFAQRRGFISAGYEDHDEYATAIVTGVGLETERLEVQLQPDASITGHIVDEAGDAVRSAQVSLFSERHDTGTKQIKMYNSAQTDAFGDYNFGSLAPGIYFVAVSAQAWYAVPASPPDPQGLFPNGVDPALDVAYPITFFGNGTREEAAVSIALKPGERRRADVRLSPVRALRIKVGTRPGSPNTMVSALRTPVFDSFEQIPALAQTNSAGENELIGLAPRKYDFETTEQGPDGRSQSGELDLALGSAEIDPQRIVANGSMVLNLSPEDGGKLPDGSFIVLRGTRPLSNDRQAINADGTATFTNLPADDYHFQVYADSRPWQILRVDSGEKHLAQDHWSLSAGEAANLKLVVAGTAKSVEGIALRGGKPVAGAMIVLAPVDALDNPDLFRRDQSDLDGTFGLLNVAAGRYIVVAIDDGWKLEWGKPEVLTRFLLEGRAVAIPATQRQSFHLPGPITVQDR